MNFKPTWPQVLQDVMSKCWLAEPAARPHFRDVAVELSFDSNPVVYAALAQASAGDGADYSTCDDSALEATDYSTCDDSAAADAATYSTCDDGALAGDSTDNEGVISPPKSEYRESTPVAEYAPQATPQPRSLGYENIPAPNQQQLQVAENELVKGARGKGIQRKGEGRSRKGSVYAGFGEINEDVDVNSGGGGIHRDGRQGSVCAGFDGMEEDV
jgi:hypothetical protein